MLLGSVSLINTDEEQPNYKFKIGDYFELTDPLFSPEGRGVMVEKVTDDIGRQHPES